MPSKRRGRRRRKTYRCEVCDGTRDEPVVACDKCDKWHHFTCVGIESIGSKDEWFCDKCKPTESPQQEESTQQSEKEDNTSNCRVTTPSPQQKENRGDSNNDYDLRYDQSHPYNQADPRHTLSQRGNSENRSVDHQRDRQSDTRMTRSQEMELQLIQEERVLSGIRDREYLKKKYQILTQSEPRRHSMQGIDENRSLAHTRSWVEQQRSVRKDLERYRTSVCNEHKANDKSEYRRLDTSGITTKPATPAKNENQPKIRGISDLLRCNVCNMVGEDANFEACLLCFKQCHFGCMDILMLGEETRYICPDCKDINSQESQRRTEKPADTPAKSVRMLSQQHKRNCATCLQTDNPAWFRNCEVCRDVCHYSCMSITTMYDETVWICRKCKVTRVRPTKDPERERLPMADLPTPPCSRKFVSEPAFSAKQGKNETIADNLLIQHTRSLSPRKYPGQRSHYETPEPHEQNRTCGTCGKADDQKRIKYCDVCDTLHHFSCLTIAAIQNEIVWICEKCKEVKTKPKNPADNGPKSTTVSQDVKTPAHNQSTMGAGDMVTTSIRSTSQTLTSAQIASRHVVTKDLPIFSGQPEQWPMFLSRFNNSTNLCGFSDSENLDRLQKCLKGNALDAVRSRLLTAESVPEIMSTLKMLYGRPELIVDALMKKIRAKPPPKADQLNTMVDFALAVKNVCATLEQANLGYHLSNPALIQELVEKLPTNFKVDWARHKATKSDVTLSTLGNFLFELATVISTVTEPTMDKDDSKPKKNTGQRDSNSRDKRSQARNREFGYDEKNTNPSHVYAHQSQQSQQKSNTSSSTPDKADTGQCKICNQKCKTVESCPVFISYDVDRRWQERYNHKLCRMCLGRHGRFCGQKKSCGVNGCIFKHHSLLHDEKRHSAEAIANQQKSVVHSNNIHFSTIRSVFLRIVPVTLHCNERFIYTFAYQDDGSDVTMIEQSLCQTLGVTGNVEPLCLMWTATMHRKENNSRRVEIEMSGQGDFQERFTIRGARTVETLGLPIQTVDKQKLIEYFPYLKDIPFIEYYSAIPQILIGSDNAHLNTPQEIIEGNFDQPIACKSRIGWSIHGRTDDRSTQSNVQVANIHRTKCPCQQASDEEIHKMVKEHFTIENFGVQAGQRLQLCSKEDERALQLLEKHTRRIGKRFETALLWRFDDVKLPNSYGMAMKRLQCLEKHKPAQIEIIDRTINEYVQKGYARKLTDSDIQESQNARIWYLPIFTVTHPKKPEKIRVVFDGAAKVNGVSLNSLLLKGPDQLSSLVDILRRFREKCVATAGDITEMFPQIKIRREDVNCQRFLWRNGDINKKPDQYVLDVMTFGANCSPASAQFVKNRNASHFKKEMPRAFESIVYNHYVDDMLDCQHSDTEMIQLIRDVKEIHLHAGFEMRKFLSNSAAVKSEFNEPDQSNKSLDMSFGIERVLGMWWNTDSDSFTYSLKYTKIDPAIVNGSRTPTKRELLKILMTIFDPLGLLSHYLIHLKIIIQDVWRSNLDWDDEIKSDQIKAAWKEWFELLPCVENVKIPRLYSTKISPGVPKSIELHMFVDASEKAFSAVGYLRVEDEDGDVECVLVGAKSRVSPLKYMSTPRLELQAGVLGSRLLANIEKAQTLKIDRRHIWTDSRTLLSWLHSDNRRYHQFVAYRVGEILETTELSEWRWVTSKENVADDATNWSRPPNFERSGRWFSGPEFLKLPKDQWPDELRVVPDTLEEMKLQYAHAKVIIPNLIDAKNISTWNKMHRAVAYARRYALILRARLNKETAPQGPLTREELQIAEILLIRQAQFEDFTEEMVILVRNKSLPIDQHQYVQPTSPLYKCTPYLDENGLIRLHGRIDSANDVAFTTKRPIILPRNNRITRLLIAHVHHSYHHRNHRTVYNEIRQKYYVPQLRVVLNAVRNECQRCKNKRARAQQPQMADLPPARLAIGFRAFTYIGIDYFGPMYVVIGRRNEKRWGVMITCLTVRAVHVEIAYKLDTESCIMCIRNFIYWRGCPREIYSDCGTNLKGMDNTLQKLVSELNVDLMASEFTTYYTKWNFNPPASPHMGGAWERMIKSVKTCLYDILPTRHPTEDMLRNLLLEVCNIINSRPLTYIPIENENDEILTPNHFILGSSNGLKPFIDVNADGPILRSKWIENQRLTDIFWSIFIKEFLPDLTRRTKWHEPVHPIQVGDIVLLVDGTNIRGQYPMCRVIETYIGSNDQVRRAKIERFSNEGSKLKKSVYWRPTSSLAKLDVHPKTSSSVPTEDRQTEGSVMNDGNTADATSLVESGGLH